MATSIIKGVTAWQNHEEWETVYKELYSGDRKQQQHAVDRMGVWWIRFGDRLSSAIINSYELMSALLANNVEKDCEIHRQALAMSIVRFVNFTTDKKQKNAHARSTLGIAQELEIPEWLVEMRHGITHQGSLPASPMLIHAAKTAMEWLRSNYWEAQQQGKAGNHGAQRNKSKLMNSIENLLIQYMQAQYHVCQGDEDGDETISLLLDELCGLMSDRDGLLDIAVELLCQEGFMIPTDEQFQSLNLSHSELLATETCDIPKPLVLLWQPLLTSLNRMGFCVTLLEHLANMDTVEGSLLEHLVNGWVYHILNTYGVTEEIPGEHRQLHVHDVILKLLDKPNKYTTQSLQLAFQLDHHFTSSQQKELTNLIQVVLNDATLDLNCNTINNEKIYSAKDFLVSSPKKQKSDETKESINSCMDVETEVLTDRKRVCEGWQLADESIAWSRYPIGSCPGYMGGNPFALELYDVYPSQESGKPGIVFKDSDDTNGDGEEEEDRVEAEEEDKVDQEESSSHNPESMEQEEKEMCEQSDKAAAKSMKWDNKQFMRNLKRDLAIV
jgi:hypothetical protein